MTQQPEANQVPLVELLAAVPADIRIGVDDGNDWKAGTTWHPVGRLCHEAAAELRRLHQSEREGWRYAKEWEARAIRLAKALGQAMEALEQYTDVVTSVNDPNSWVKVEDGGKPARKAITTAKQTLEDKS